MNVQSIERVIGARGLNPNGRNLREFELIDRLEGEGVQIHIWNEAALGAQPSAEELALAGAPLIALAVEPNGTGDGLIFTATLTNAPDGTATNWRLLPPDGSETLDSDNTTLGIATWEIETNEPGVYLVQVWAAGYGFAELSAEGI